MADVSIIEKNSGSPMATSCLVIALVALLGAIFFQLVEINELRGGEESSADDIVTRYENSFKKRTRGASDSIKEVNSRLDIAMGGEGAAEDELEEIDEDEEEEEDTESEDEEADDEDESADDEDEMDEEEDEEE